MNTQTIVKYLVDTYQPEAALLIGSRMEGTAKQDSDWDIILIEPKTKVSGHISWNTETLDINSKDWPKEGEPITTPIKPVYPCEVLLDTSNGKLDRLLKITKDAYEKGPLSLYKDAVIARYDKLSRWQHKTKKYADNPPVQFFYAGIFYEFAMRAWLELQNKWSLPPEQTLQEIRSADTEFADMLVDFCTCDSVKRVALSDKIMETLQELREHL